MMLPALGVPGRFAASFHGFLGVKKHRNMALSWEIVGKLLGKWREHGDFIGFHDGISWDFIGFHCDFMGFHGGWDPMGDLRMYNGDYNADTMKSTGEVEWNLNIQILFIYTIGI